VILSLDLAARRLGLRPGTPVAKAQALYPHICIMDADARADHAGLERLALWCAQRVAPIAAADPPDGIVIDTTGSDHLHGGEAAMLADLLARLGQSGFLARAAIADTWGAAHAMARYGRERIAIVSPGAQRHTLADLPIAALRLPPESCTALQALGLVRVKDLAVRPRAPLSLRFGPQIGRRLDHAFGLAAEPIIPIRPDDPIETCRLFAEPIAAPETIARYIGKLVVPLCGRLEALGLGARQLDLVCYCVDNRVESIRVGMARPLRDIARLTRLLCDRIETIDPGFGIERMVLRAMLTEGLTPRQSASDLIEDCAPDISGLIDILTNRVGASALYRFAPVESDVPERAVHRVPPLAVDEQRRWPDHWPRPERLLPNPEPIQTLAVLPDHPPAFFIWRGVRRNIMRADGPERIFGEWWKADAEWTAARDYFRVEDTNGERFWLYRAGDGEHGETGSQSWFLHGLFG